MAITQAMCTSFKKELLEGVHNFKNSGGNTFRLALYTSSATMSAATTAYTTSQEASGTNYTAKGDALTRVDPTSSGTTAFTKTDGGTGSVVATRVIEFTGALTGSRIVTFPVLTENFYLLKNISK